MNKKLVSLAAAAALLGGSTSAFVVAPTLASAAEVTTTADRAPGQWVKDALAGLVTSGTINQSQADEVASTLEAARPERGGGHRGGGRHMSTSTAAEVIGITPAELRTAMGTTKSIADVAREKDVDVQKVVDALVAEASAHIDEHVAEGKLTQAEADERKAATTERVTEKVNSVGFQGRGQRNG